MMGYFVNNSLSLNLDKSSYFIISPTNTDHKVTLRLTRGYLKYKATQRYLGVIITDCGSIKHDISQFINEKRSNVSVKFVNFCNKNFFAHLHVKLRVLGTCVTSSLSYGAETWANFGDEIEVICRNGLRTALGIRTNINNEMVYVESQRFPVRCRIARQQLKFWLIVQEYININPDSALKHFLDKALETNLPCIEHYKRLQLMNESPNKCLENHKNIFKDKWTSNLERSVEDIDSRLATYKQINLIIIIMCSMLYVS